MQRNPNWPADFAADFLDLVETDDGPEAPLVFEPGDGERELSAATVGVLGPETDPERLDIVEVELDAAALYSFFAIASLEDGTATLPDLRIFDDEGYLLLSTDGATLGIEEPGSDTIWQFAPSYSGTHYLAVSLAHPELSASYGIAANGTLPEVDPDTGNTRPVALDDPLRAEAGETILVDPLVNDLDADGDALAAVEIFQRIVDRGEGEEELPIEGVAGFLPDGRIVYRAPESPDAVADLGGVDSFGYRLADARGADDIAFVAFGIDAAAPPAEGTVTRAEAQRVAYLYEAALDRDGEIDEAGLNFWINALTPEGGGYTFEELAGFFTANPEFEAAFGTEEDLSDDEYVELLYRNVLDRASDPDGFAFWSGVLDELGGNREVLLLAFADSVENMLGSPDIAAMSYGDTDEDGIATWAI